MFVVVYSWRVSSKSTFLEQWRKTKLHVNLDSWNYRLSIEGEMEAGEEGIFSLHTRWQDEASWFFFFFLLHCSFASLIVF